MSNGANGRFSGKVNDGAAISGAVVPQGTRSAFRIQSDNAGGVLRSAGLLKNARNGDMDLTLRPATAKGSYNGKLTVRQLRLKDAPALAALLNALSVIGILEQLAGDGIHFSEVEANFHLSPKVVTLTQGTAVGASMGISMEGYYFMESGEMDMQGVFSPIYLVNSVGNLFTRKGEGLLGFNYRLNGPAAVAAGAGESAVAADTGDVPRNFSQAAARGTAVKLSDFDFDLPEALIATRPVKPRSASRLLVAEGDAITDAHVHDLVAWLRPGDRLVLNDTRVIPARLTGQRTAAWRAGHDHRRRSK